MDLRGNFEAYKIHYYNKNYNWFDEYFSCEGRVIESNVSLTLPCMNMDEDFSISDMENVKVVYESLKHLSPSQATQERLWAGLSHLQFRDYSFYRLKKDFDNQNDKRINTSLFFRNGNKRSLFVHILARLWWVGHMTYDETEESPYRLTEFFCEKDFSARSVIFFSSNFTSNKNITRGILRSLIKLKENGIDVKREHFVLATKYMNVVGGAMILDILTTEAIEKMVDAYLNKQLRGNIQVGVVR